MIDPFAGTAGTRDHSQTRYAGRIRALSDRLVQAQRPIRILDAVKWDDSIERRFFARKCRELPPVTADYYGSRPLAFDPRKKQHELTSLERDIGRQLGKNDAPGQIMSRMCREYRQVVDLLARRGTPRFAQISAGLYGRTSDPVHTSPYSLAEWARLIASRLHDLCSGTDPEGCERSYDAQQTVALLSTRLRDYFKNEALVRVKLSDGIVADAAAGGDYLKIRRAARFTARDIRLLEVHEGWVHLATTLNGQRQPICTFLSKGPPSSTITQEGLAVLMEIMSSATYPGRIRRLAHRVEALARAEAGANFLETFQFFCEQGYAPCESYQNSKRVFRGSLPDAGGPFTKDLSYIKGLILIVHHLRLAADRGQVHDLPVLFCGKTALSDFAVLAQLVEEGLVQPAHFLPPSFADLLASSGQGRHAQLLDRLAVLHQDTAPSKTPRKAG
jgi:uncharacterized protein (TIGR02421 family)